MKRMSGRVVPSPAMLVAFAALLVALGGSAYAAVKLPARSVGTRELKRSAVGKAQLKANAVDASRIKANAVTGADVANDSLTGDDINEAVLGPVRSATNAGSSAALDRVVYRAAVGTVAPAIGLEPSRATGTATCDPGQLVVGGGVKVEDPSVMSADDSYPDGGGRSWTANVVSDDTAAPHPFSVFAICVPAGAPG
jgi:hypothetical protein